MTDQEIQALREEFPLLHHQLYLNNCSLGALPNRSTQYIQHFLDLWNEGGTEAWKEWFPQLQRIKDLLSPILSASSRDIALSPNVSTALTMVASMVAPLFPKRPKVVVSELDFPTTVYQWLVKKPLGVELVVVKSRDGLTIDLDDWAKAIDARTALVATGHVFYLTSAIQDIEALAQIAHDQGALIAIDGYHAVGTFPLQLHQSHVDFYVGGVLKWLLGGPGTAFLWTPEHIRREFPPTVASWLGSKEPFAFHNTRWEPADDATQLEFGTPPVQALYQAQGGLEIINQVGLETIRQRHLTLSRRLLQQTAHLPLSLHSPIDDEKRGGMVLFETPRAHEVVQELVKQHVIIDERPGLLRISPHFYNTEEEIDQFVESLTAALAK